MPEPLAPTPPANVIEISRREDIKSCFMFSEVQEGDLIAITNLDRFIEGPCKATLYAGPARYRQEISSVARLTKGWLEAMAEFDGVIEIACPFEASAVQERKLTRGFAFREPEPCTRREF